jgi:hypothetical protein
MEKTASTIAASPMVCAVKGQGPDPPLVPGSMTAQVLIDSVYVTLRSAAKAAFFFLPIMLG